MSKKQYKILYLNIVIIIAFLSAITLIFVFLTLDKKDMSILTGEICSPIIVGSFTFWNWELMHLFKKGD